MTARPVPSPPQSDGLFHGLWSLWDMYTLQLKPILDTQDLLRQWSVHLHSNNENRIINLQNKTELLIQLDLLLETLPEDEFAMCRIAVGRLRDTLRGTERDDSQIEWEVDDLLRRIIDQTGLIFCFGLSSHDRALYEPTAHSLEIKS